MRIIDTNGQHTDSLMDETRKIPLAHLSSVCKINQKEKTCRYIFCSMIGHVCLKKTPMKQVFDQLVNKKEMISAGNNCEGLGIIQSKDKNEKENS